MRQKASRTTATKRGTARATKSRKKSSPSKRKSTAPTKKKGATSAKRKLRKKTTKTSSQINFDYIKGSFFRTIHADGAIGSITSPGYVHMALFSERPAIPQRVTQKVRLDKVSGAFIVGEESGRVSRDSIVREMEVDVLLDKEAAKRIQEWLGEKIKELETREIVVSKFTKVDAKAKTRK